MIIQRSAQHGDGKELEIRDGSHLFCRDAGGNEVFKEWAEIDEETRSQLSELVTQADGIMKKAETLLRG